MKVKMMVSAGLVLGSLFLVAAPVKAQDPFDTAWATAWRTKNWRSLLSLSASYAAAGNADSANRCYLGAFQAAMYWAQYEPNVTGSGRNHADGLRGLRAIVATAPGAPGSGRNGVWQSAESNLLSYQNNPGQVLQGTWHSSWGNLRIRAHGRKIYGALTYGSGRTCSIESVNGQGFNGTTMRFTWRNSFGESGDGVLRFNPSTSTVATASWRRLNPTTRAVEASGNWNWTRP